MVGELSFENKSGTKKNRYANGFEWGKCARTAAGLVVLWPVPWWGKKNH